ncbi:hypothetical protein CLAFUW4_12968 [Fulvia fulva]|uniref:Uncharacterized protein n=1 Tax=Passalora fulva TaxID=5499 RepID=A0A9Q8PJU2_PASFU|nr:uncharacterized protein CLAFUR5_12831 [Fulvia fulva]KAK4612133.1 hypothetical protein CLAFUR4_12972 [Fulvia fulva]KAK4612591.1 hypothetical protein CLAFUR0_12977 [Fulvia fulva]UJO23732.1 hypothetical protein CLAFUR5_12831 [Fulvia fulva]WPV21577.1 hypothetical protein CLAFUW4_12968 [Fulvia fulva]WPV36337.1 hypothetical protein CLAFUW7_12975 [Fulvia fulva]
MAAAPHVEHTFHGDTRLLNASLKQRAEIRQALTTLQQELQRLEGCSVQVTADIKFNVAGPQSREHAYFASITDVGFDPTAFAQTKVPAMRNGAIAMSPAAPGHDGRRSSLIRSAPDDDDVVEVQGPKRPRTDGPDGLSRSGSIAEDGTGLKQVNELSTYMRSWHDEWTRQGGWLFDTLNTTNKLTTESKTSVEKRLDSVQDTLGQSINAASATTMGELANITKLLPWLEHCRKTNADKVQAREEKWRSSSATFHDQTRREREAAERRLEDKLEAQQRLLIKVAEANGIDVDELSEKPRSREESLGAQLTAELNLEAARAASNGTLTRYNNTINIDD